MKKLSLLALVAVILTTAGCWRKKDDTGCSTCSSHAAHETAVLDDRESGPMQAGVTFDEADLK
jgi:hypothetical protein